MVDALAQHANDVRALERELDTLWAPTPLAHDPLVRLAAVVAIVVFLFFVPTALLAAVTASVLFAGAARLVSPVRVALLALVPALLALVLNAVTEPGPTVFAWGPLSVTTTGIAAGIDRAIRLFGFVALGHLAVAWIDAARLADAITGGGGRPDTVEEDQASAAAGGDSSAGAGDRSGTSVDVGPAAGRLESIGWTLALAVRSWPAVREEASRLRMAARARPGGAERGALGRLRSLAPFFLPLLAGTVRRADEIAVTLDARGFASGPRTSRRAPAGGAGRLVAVLGLALATALSLWLAHQVAG